MAELDVDKSGALEVSEVAAAVRLLKESRQSVRRLRCVVGSLLIAVILLVLSIFGVSYAAALLAVKLKSSSGVLADAATGRALVTAGASIGSMTSFVAGNATFAAALNQSAAGGSRLLGAATSTSAPGHGDLVLTSRRRMVHEDSLRLHVHSHHARRLAQAGDDISSGSSVDDDADVVPGVRHRGRRMAAVAEASPASADLAALGVVGGAVALELCRMVRIGHYQLALPGFDPARSGAAGFVATLLPAATAGCGGGDDPATSDLSWFGLAADFTGRLSPLQAADSTFHIDCRPPVSEASSCTVSAALFATLPPEASQLSASPLEASLLSAADAARLFGDEAAFNESMASIAAAVDAQLPAPSLEPAAPAPIAVQPLLAGGGGDGAVRRLQTTTPYYANGRAYTTRWSSSPHVPFDIYPASGRNKPPGLSNPLTFTYNGTVLSPFSQRVGQLTGNATFWASVRYNGSDAASPWDNAMLACAQSFTCLLGFLDLTNKASGALASTARFGLEKQLRAVLLRGAPGTLIDVARLRATLDQLWLDGSRFVRPSLGSMMPTVPIVGWAVCPPNHVVEMTGVPSVLSKSDPWFRCKLWNEKDVDAGAREIAESCHNAFEVLEWYFIWHRHHKVAYYTPMGYVPPPGSNWAYPGPPERQAIVADSCRNTAPTTIFASGSGLSAPSSFWGAGSTASGRHAWCYDGRALPVCQTARILLGSKQCM